MTEMGETRGPEDQKGMCKRPGGQRYQHYMLAQWRIEGGLQKREAFLRNTIVAARWGMGG